LPVSNRNRDSFATRPIEGIEKNDGNCFLDRRLRNIDLFRNSLEGLLEDLCSRIQGCLPVLIGFCKDFWNGGTGQDVVELVEENLFPGGFEFGFGIGSESLNCC